MSNPSAVHVTGLREFRKGLKQVDEELPKEMKKGFGRIAQKLVDLIQPKVRRVTGTARGSVKARSSGSIVAGGRKAEHYPWLDFGGRVGRDKSISRPVIPGGRYIYPTIGEQDKFIKDSVDEVLADTAKAAGFEVSGDGA